MWLRLGIAGTDELLRRMWSRQGLQHVAKSRREVSRASVKDRTDTSDAVAAHVLLNSSAAVVMGIEMLKDHWGEMSQGDRSDVFERIHRQAVTINRDLTDAIRGR